MDKKRHRHRRRPRPYRRRADPAGRRRIRRWSWPLSPRANWTGSASMRMSPRIAANCVTAHPRTRSCRRWAPTWWCWRCPTARRRLRRGVRQGRRRPGHRRSVGRLPLRSTLVLRPARADPRQVARPAPDQQPRLLCHRDAAVDRAAEGPAGGAAGVLRRVRLFRCGHHAVGQERSGQAARQPDAVCAHRPHAREGSLPSSWACRWNSCRTWRRIFAASPSPPTSTWRGKMTREDVVARFRHAYEGEPLVHVVDEAPWVSAIAGTASRRDRRLHAVGRWQARGAGRHHRQPAQGRGDPGDAEHQPGDRAWTNTPPFRMMNSPCRTTLRATLS